MFFLAGFDGHLKTFNYRVLIVTPPPAPSHRTNGVGDTQLGGEGKPLLNLTSVEILTVFKLNTWRLTHV